MPPELEEDYWAETIEEEAPPKVKPDPYETLKADYDSLKTQLESGLPSEEDREILTALKGLRAPKEKPPDEAEEKLSNAIKLLAEKGVITQDNPDVKAVLGFMDELKAEREEAVKTALQAEGFKSPQALEAKLTYLYHQELEESEQKELATLLQPYFDNNGMKNPVKIAQALKGFLEKKEGAALPSKPIDTSFKGRATSGTQTSNLPDRHEFFREVLPKMTDAQKEKFYQEDNPQKYYRK